VFLTRVSFVVAQDFETERGFDTVTVLAGGRTEREAAPLATLSGKQDLSTRLFVSASNFMVVKFSSDASVERKGFRASWKTEPQSCLGNLKATGQSQDLSSPGYPANYPGGLECLYIITAQPGKIITLDVSTIFIFKISLSKIKSKFNDLFVVFCVLILTLVI
jgi:CUB domain